MEKNMWVVPMNPSWFDTISYMNDLVKKGNYEYGVYRSLGLDIGDYIYFLYNISYPKNFV